MSILANVTEAAEAHHRFVQEQVRRARNEPAFAEQLRQRWKSIQDGVENVTTPTGLKVPRLALPATDEPGAIAQYLYGEGLPGEFPFVNAAYQKMYLESTGSKTESARRGTEEPTRLFAGLGLAEDTNQRFHYLTRHQASD